MDPFQAVDPDVRSWMLRLQTILEEQAPGWPGKGRRRAAASHRNDLQLLRSRSLMILTEQAPGWPGKGSRPFLRKDDLFYVSLRVSSPFLRKDDRFYVSTDVRMTFFT